MQLELPNLNQSDMKTKRTMILTIACGVLTLFATRSANAQTLNQGIIDPTSPYAGKTYSEWVAGFWQYYMSLPATNNPFVYDPAYPVTPLSKGQSGPAWFLCGNYAAGGTHVYTNTIPGGIALFAGITDIEWDHVGCPYDNTYTEEQLRAFAKATEDGATNMTCTIDGVAIGGLTNVMTSAYRVQSPVFSYTCPAVHNILYDLFGAYCYQRNTGIPYTNHGAVEDGVFLMIAPLSAGSHVIHTTCALTLNPPYAANFTHYLTVKPVALTVSGSPQPGNLMLNWPQTPDSYSVQTSPSLNPADWQPANLIVTTNNGIVQATAPVGTTNQFFRLQLN
jgi:hypothetical protein